MQPRLRATVRAVPTTDGMLLRMGEEFLPIAGRQTFEYFRRLTPYLDGKWTLRALTQAAPKPQRPVLRALLRALREGGMIYDASRDVHAPELADPGIVAFMPRIDAVSPRPWRALATLARTRALVISSGTLGDEVFASLRPLGLRNLTRLPLASERDEKIAPETLAKFDVVVMLGWWDVDRKSMLDVERTCERVRDAAASTRGRRTSASAPALIPLVVSPARVTVGPVLTGGSGTSFRRLADALDRIGDGVLGDGGRGDARDGESAATCAAIASSVMAQRVIDLRTGILSPDDLAMMHEIDAATLEIRQRPAPLPTLASPAWRSASPAAASSSSSASPSTASPSAASPPIAPPAPASAAPASAASAHAAAAASFLERVTRSLVDPRTGLIARLDELDLCQIPHHQSAAIWRPTGSRSPVTGPVTGSVTVTEAGETILESRAAAARRVLEACLHAVLSESSDPLAAVGIVASAPDEASLHVEAYFRALARFAHVSSAWLDWTVIPPRREALGREAALTFEYLADRREIDTIRIERCTTISTGCEVWRVAHRDRLVSFVAGVDGRACQEKAWRDAWLCVTAPAAKGPAAEDPHPLIRYRHGAGEAPAIPAGALPFVYRPMAWPEPWLLEPLRFACAAIAGEEARR
jgi:hypothetical protein